METNRKKNGRRYPESFKRQVCEEYIQGGQNQKEVLSRNKIDNLNALSIWLRRYGYLEKKDNFAQKEIPIMPKRKLNSAEYESLVQRIKELERELEDEKLRSEGFNLMIDIAEKEFKIGIRKKFVPKQSEK